MVKVFKNSINSKRTKKLLNAVAAITVLAFDCVFGYFIIELANGYIGYSDIVVSIQTLITIIALLIAIFAILFSVREPEFLLLFYDQHGVLINENDIKLGVNDNGEIGYLPYSPSDWELCIVNNGETVAENVMIEISFDNVSFNDKSYLYEVKDFEYGLGTFEKLVLDTGITLRPGEAISIPKIPFAYAETCVQDGMKVKMSVIVFNNNRNVVDKIYDISIEKDDLVLNKAIDEVIFDDYVIEEICDFARRQEETRIEIIDSILDPYKCIIDSSKNNAYRRIYEAYLNCDSVVYTQEPNARSMMKKKLSQSLKNKKLFWGRIYYRSEGLPIQDIELIVKNDIDYGIINMKVILNGN